jgi:hypothetical protein
MCQYGCVTGGMMFIVKKTAANRDHTFICVGCENKLSSKGHWYVINDPYKQGWATQKKYVPRFIDYACSKVCADIFILRVM